jgi:recombination protein RecR
MSTKYPQHLLKLIAFFKLFPGVGGKTAERFAFSLLDWKSEQTQDFGKLLAQLPQMVQYCEECGCLKGEENCFFCNNPLRETGTLCLVASVKDVFAFEQTRTFSGLYHVLGGLLSPLEGLDPESLSLEKLKKRILEKEIKEVILALDSTVEGDTTALYIKQFFSSLPLKLSRLAFGLPLGSNLDFIDGGTLARALGGRQSF